MKCPNCNYAPRSVVEIIDKVTRFQRGPRKGQVKHVEEVQELTFPDDPQFIELSFGHSVVAKVSQYEKSYHDDRYYLNYNETNVILSGCPKCGTVFMGVIPDPKYLY